MLTETEILFYRQKWVVNWKVNLDRVFRDAAEGDRVVFDSVNRINSSKLKLK